MGLQDIDFDLSEEERAVRDLVHRFAEEVMRPAGQQLDQLAANEVIAADSVLWKVHRQWNELGIRLFSDSGSDLSPEQAARLGCLVNEQLGWGDAGLAISLGVTEFPAMLARITGNPDLIAAFPPEKSGCWAITEPDHGSDVVDFRIRDDLSRLEKPNCLARLDGDEYVING